MENNKIEQKIAYDDGKYKIFNVSDGPVDHRKIVCDTEAICLIPFDTSSGKIQNIYLSPQSDYLDGSMKRVSMCYESKGEFSSNFEEVHSLCKDNLNIDCDVNDVYFLGKIKHQFPFQKTYKCYAINLDNYSEDEGGFKLDLPPSEINQRNSTIEKIKFNRVMNGEIEDSICLSSAMLLVSYLNS